MININKQDLSQGLDLLFKTPQLNNLNTKKELKNIFQNLMEDMYLDQTDEIKKNFRNKPNKKIIETSFLNYGILPSYYEKLNPIIKRKLIYYLELLFQQKGSIDNLKIISELFRDFFKDINYYGISVNKLPYRLNGLAITPGTPGALPADAPAAPPPDNTNVTTTIGVDTVTTTTTTVTDTGETITRLSSPIDLTKIDPTDDSAPTVDKRKFILSYFLKPIDIPRPDLIKYFPNFKIDLTGKYLMKIKQFENFSMFPIDTNLIYIDFIDSSYLLHSDKYFINGALAFTMTKYKRATLNFQNNNFLKMLENIQFKDIFLILQYYNLRFIRFAQIGRNQLDPSNNETLMDFSYNPVADIGSNLIFDDSYLDTIEILLLEYKNLKIKTAKKVRDLSRRWQFLLQSNYNLKDDLFKSFDDIENFIIKKYPSLKITLDSFEDNPGVYSGTQITQLLPEEIIEVSKMDYINFLMNFYIDVLNQISDGNEFVDLSINAIFQNILNSGIFIDYFFTPVFKLFVNYFMPGNMDYIVNTGAKVIVKDKFEGIFIESNYKLDIFTCHMDARYPPCDKIYINSHPIQKDNLPVIRFSKSMTLNRHQNCKIPFKKYVGFHINHDYTSAYDFSTRNLDNSGTKLNLNKQNTDSINNYSDSHTLSKIKYNFFKNLNNEFIKDYMWKLERNLGIVNQIDTTKEIYGHMGNLEIPNLKDYTYLKKEMYLDINNYLFYKNNYN